jgi:hypothetical protein
LDSLQSFRADLAQARPMAMVCGDPYSLQSFPVKPEVQETHILSMVSAVHHFPAIMKKAGLNRSGEK